MNRTSTSLVFVGSVSICHRGLMSQLITTRVGRSYASTRPQLHSLPSTPRSYTRPPTRGSNTRSAIGTARRLYSGGNHVPMPSVKTVNASSSGASTTTCTCTLVSWTSLIMGSPHFVWRPLCSAREAGVPKALSDVRQLPDVIRLVKGEEREFVRHHLCARHLQTCRSGQVCVVKRRQ